MDGNFIGDYRGLNTAKGTIGYAIDIVFCIDGTGSRQEALNRIREIIPSMLQDVRIGSQNQGRNGAQLRSRLIVFRDYIADGKDAMQATDFFCSPCRRRIFWNAFTVFRQMEGEILRRMGWKRLPLRSSRPGRWQA